MTRAEWKIEPSDRQPSARRGSTILDSRAGEAVARQYGCNQVSSGARPITTLRNSQSTRIPAAGWDARGNRIRQLHILTRSNGRGLQPVVLEIA
ncbi:MULTISPECIES: hypothetical protein [Sphingomonas]|uniref:hypothetical protein n=1 Tax=Sphingomonas TaxID=13687 RepID=UPI000F7EA137|nr:hypothetical protein [Sphingomonas sp. ABOLF]GLK22173.1 hypothetical protein GCM10017606_30010 [Microbacterium terregens]